MISVQNRLLPLSGNKWLLFLGITLVTGACSPKLQPVTAPVKTQTEKPVTKAEQPITGRSLPPKPATISLLLPFVLDDLNPGGSYTDADLKQANLSLDYYQGFKLALDSLTGLGYNYKLQVFDSQGTVTQAHSLAFNPQIRSSDLVIGPIFPEDLKTFIGVFTAHKPIVSPLSPANPSTFKNPDLVTVIPPLEYHARAAARYIHDRIKPQKVFILRSGYSEDNEYITPFKNTIDSLSKRSIQIVQLTVVRGKLDALLPQLSLKEPNVFVVPSTNQAFLMVTLRSLDSLAKKYPVTLFGHPSWDKFTFLHADVLQRLKTHITSADRVNYKSAATLIFLRNYRGAYHTEASDFAIKGFDEGLYFGRLLGAGHGELKNLDQTDFSGLHNDFHFIKKPGSGYINTHVNILTYSNFELKQAE
jgi:hypothetical protein